MPAAERLSSLVGRPVLGTDVRPVGRVADLAVSLGDPHPLVTEILIRSRDGSELAAPAEGAVVAPDGLRLALPARPAGTTPSRVRLARDVLDAQIVDVRGRRLVRVADVELAARRGELRAIAVDVGFGAVLRRLGLGRVAHLGGRDAIDWPDLHLASAAGHRLQLDSPAAAVHRLGPEELADLVARLPGLRADEVLDAVPDDRARLAARAARHRPRRRFPHRRTRRARA